MKSRIFFVAACILILTTSVSFGYQATFIPRISVNEEYTDNVFLTERNKEHDYITTISPGFTAQILGKNSGAEISYDAGYSMYDEYDEYDGWRHDARFSGWVDMAKNTRLEVRDSFLYTEDPLTDSDIAMSRATDPDVLIDSTIRQSRQTYYTNTAGINLIHQFGRADSFNIGFIHSFLENDDSDYEDNERYNPYVGLTYWFAPEWGLDIRGSYTRAEFDESDDFEDSDDSDQWNGSVRLIKKITRQLEGFVQYSHRVLEYDGDTDEDYQVYTPSAGFSYTISDDIFFSLGLGCSFIDREEGDDDSAMSANGSLTKTFKRGSINIVGSGGYEESDYGAENLGVTEFYQLGASAAYQIARRFSGNIFGSYRNSDYIDEIPEREDDITRAGVGLSMQALEWMSLSLNYAYRKVNSTLDQDDYDENRVIFRITLFPPHPFRMGQY